MTQKPESTQQTPYVRYLAEVLACFDDEMAEHSAKDIAGVALGIRAPVQVFRGQGIEIPPRLPTHRIVVRQSG